VFDGSIPTVASGRTFLNYRFSQVGRINPAGHGFMFFPGSEFPFAYMPVRLSERGALNRRHCPGRAGIFSGSNLRFSSTAESRFDSRIHQS
jgi:hypothetical protein